MTLLALVQNVLGTPPVGYEYLVYKTAGILLIGFYASLVALVLQFQRSFGRRVK